MNWGLGLFLVFAVIGVVSSVAVIATQHVVRAALALVLNFLALAGLYFLMSLDILGISQVLVYTGLIMMLFLFCILLLNLSAPEMLQEKSGIKWFFAVVFAAGLVAVVTSQAIAPLALAEQPTAPDDFGKAKVVGTYLFNHWVYGFEICSILLLIGIVGSILLAKRR
ncbi:MAG TPA: NADH-quinone oxidoreductase subunit J [Fimbriimonadales bacterium]|nr:NADH-quinone oxidoreductase subunit J [Fimbriimonadales bacterium]